MDDKTNKLKISAQNYGLISKWGPKALISGISIIGGGYKALEHYIYLTNQEMSENLDFNFLEGFVSVAAITFGIYKTVSLVQCFYDAKKTIEIDYDNNRIHIENYKFPGTKEEKIISIDRILEIAQEENMIQRWFKTSDLKIKGITYTSLGSSKEITIEIQNIRYAWSSREQILAYFNNK